MAIDELVNEVEPRVVVDLCTHCANELGLEGGDVDASAQVWLCSGCSSIYIARRNARSGDEPGARLLTYKQLMLAIHDQIEEPRPAIRPQDAQRLVQCLSRLPYRGEEKRSNTRHAIAAPIIVTPLDASLRITSRPYRSTIINVSSNGAAFIHVERVAEPYLVIDFSASGVNLLPAVCRVLRTRTNAVGAKEVGVKFIARVTDVER
jgi:hypothetical protein